MDALINIDATMVALVAAVLSLIALFVALVVSARQRRLLNRYKKLLNGPTGPDLEQLVLKQIESTEETRAVLALLKKQVESVSGQAQRHIQKLAIIRFNAFPDTGSDLSFAIALLDGMDTGVVVSSLYGRNESRVYAKPVKNGASTYTLSDEEKTALAQAIGPKG